MEFKEFKGFKKFKEFTDFKEKKLTLIQAYLKKITENLFRIKKNSL